MVLLVAKTQDQISQLEAYVYDEFQEKVYANRDLMLPNFLLCFEWLDVAGSPSSLPKKGFGSHIPVGAMDPVNGIPTLDVLEGMYSDMVIGRPGKSTMHVPVPLGTGKKRKKKAEYRAISTNNHADAVLIL